MPRTKEQNKKILDQRKKDIIYCAIKIFSEKDYKSVTIDDITNKLKISHGLFYHYFKNKSDLVKTILAYAEEQIMTDFRFIAKKYTGIEFFTQHISLLLKNLKQKDTTLLITFLNSVVKDTFSSKEDIESSILERFYSSAVYKNIKQLNLEGKLHQSIDATFKLMTIITNGLCNLAKDGKLSKANILPKHIIKALFVVEPEVNNN